MAERRKDLVSLASHTEVTSSYSVSCDLTPKPPAGRGLGGGADHKLLELDLPCFLSFLNCAEFVLLSIL